MNDQELYDRWKALAGLKLLKVDFMDTERGEFYYGAALALIFEDGTRVELTDTQCYITRDKEEGRA